ncbi:MAG: exosortase A [Paucibacter sp.]|nr:exosortase A [Roseateles sp.]
MSLSRIPEPWRRALPGLLLVLAAILLLYGRTGLAMVEIWDRSGTFAHAFVVPPIALWLIWRRREDLARFEPRPMPWVLLPMALLGLGWLLGELVAVNAVTQLAFTAMLVLAVPLCLGWQVTRLIAFPLLFLFFSVPIGEFMLPVMMEWTANFTVAALRASGVPVYREGLSFVIPTGSWSVVEACSGVRYLIASVMVGTLFAYLNYRSLRRRLLFVAVAATLPILANWLRAYMIVMLGHLSNNSLATGVDHIIYGWLFFGVVMLVLFIIGMRWAEPDAPPAVPKPEARAPSSPGAVAAVVAALALLALPVLALQRMDAGTPPVISALQPPQLDSQGWRPDALSADEYKPHFENPRAEIQQRYRNAAGVSLGVYIAYYRHQDYASKLVSSNNVLVQPSSKLWRSTATGAATVQVGNVSLALRTVDMRDTRAEEEAAPTRLRAFQVYWVNGRWISSDVMAKVHGALSRLTGHGDDAAVLVVYAARSDQAEAQANAFLRDNLVLLEGWLQGVKASADARARRQSIS